MNMITIQLYKQLFLAVFVFLSVTIYGQEQYQVQSAIDSTSIEIGSVINYAIQVQGNRDKLVVFPDNKSFSPLEVIKALKVDTLDEGGRYRLLKQYALTQFDTGHYTIPKQKVIIGDKSFFTDSLKVEVRDVLLDSLKIEPIKGIMPVEDLSETNWVKIIYWILGILFVAALVAFLIWKFAKDKPIPESELPAYDRAKLALSRFDGKALLEENKYKEFYSKLTDAAKGYLDEDVSENALESTTDELIETLKELSKKGKIRLKKETILQFEKTLQTADFAKFAAINPSLETAKTDKQFITAFIDAVEKGKPELSEEEKLQNEAYRLEQEKKRKRQRKKMIAWVTAGVILIGGLTYLGSVKAGAVLDLIYSRSTNGWLKKDWFTSSYGVPSISVSSPDVLERRQVEIPKEQQQMILGNQVYAFGGVAQKFYALLNTISFRQKIEVTPEQATAAIPQLLAQYKPENLTQSNEEIEIAGGVKGTKVSGDFEVTVPTINVKIILDYTAFVFTEKDGAQIVFVAYEKNDKAAKKVADRMLNSVKFNSSK